MLRVTCLALAGLFVAGTAFASQPFTATLGTPVAKEQEVIIDTNAFRCEGTTCLLVTDSADYAYDLSVCRKLSQKTGSAITAFGTAKKSFDAGRLAKCNAK